MKDLKIVSRSSIVYKNNKLNEAHFEDFGYNDYKVVLHILSKVGSLDRQGKYFQPNKLKKEHLLTAKEFSVLFKADLNNSYRFLKDSCSKLMKSRIILKSLNSDKVVEINACSKAEYEESKGRILIKFTEDILPYLVYVKRDFIIYNLNEIQKFRSVYTIRLYELLKQFPTGWVKRSVDSLKDFLGIPHNGYEQFKHFKSRVLLPACNEINMSYDTNLRFEEQRSRKKVVAITFFFSKKLPKKKLLKKQ